MHDDIQSRWDLWHLRTLFPTWGAPERAALLRAGAAFDARQQRLFGVPSRAYRRFGPAARQVLVDHPDLATGLTVSLHLGPYSLAPVPWLVAGRDVHVLVNRASLAEIRPLAETLHGELELPGRLRWVPIEGHGFALEMLRILRRGGAVFAYLDGNDGLEGCLGTLRHGLRLTLPGRDIRVRTGLARLALRLACPVHSLVTIWDEDDGFRWHRGPTWRWPAGTSPAAATAELYDWGFGVIRRHPAQWRAWNMLTGVCDSFRPQTGPAAPGAADLGAALATAEPGRALVWRRPAALWPGDMLEDLDGDCFYAAEGLQAAELDFLQQAAAFTPDDLHRRFGADWVARHLPRLLALGFVGRTDAADRPDPAGAAFAPIAG